MKLLMHIETDEGEGLTDVATVDLPDSFPQDMMRGDMLAGVFPAQALSDAGMAVIQEFIPLYREAMGK